VFRNFYECDDCGHEWKDIWSCQCDDDCPKCGARHMTPFKSEDAEGE
jgi:DNA-directed RNA polymerase subunit M/transcription elongation factor TFIIS